MKTTRIDTETENLPPVQNMSVISFDIWHYNNITDDSYYVIVLLY